MKLLNLNYVKLWWFDDGDVYSLSTCKLFIFFFSFFLVNIDFWYRVRIVVCFFVPDCCILIKCSSRSEWTLKARPLRSDSEGESFTNSEVAELCCFFKEGSRKGKAAKAAKAVVYTTGCRSVGGRFFNSSPANLSARQWLGLKNV